MNSIEQSLDPYKSSQCLKMIFNIRRSADEIKRQPLPMIYAAQVVFFLPFPSFFLSHFILCLSLISFLISFFFLLSGLFQCQELFEYMQEFRLYQQQYMITQDDLAFKESH